MVIRSSKLTLLRADLQFFEANGWGRPESTSYARMAASTGRPPEIFSAEMAAGGDHDRLCPFIVATL